jgi:CBS domain-containing protein
MKVQELMTPDVITISNDASLKEAARRMIEAGVSGLVVTDEAGTVEGVITEGDFVKSEAGRRAEKRAHLLRWFTRQDEAPSGEQQVGDVMTSDVISLSPEADHVEAARLMQESAIKRVPIISEGRLVGIVSRSDILRAFIRSDEAILQEINHVMRKVLWIDPGRVKVTSIEGAVSLRGQLETKSDATLLSDMTRRLDGVVAVDDDLTWEVDNTKLRMTPPPPSRQTNW